MAKKFKEFKSIVETFLYQQILIYAITKVIFE